MFNVLFGIGGKNRNRQKEPRFDTEHLSVDGLPDYKLFVDKNKELQSSLEALQSGHKSLIIEGRDGIGKTCLITALKRKLMEVSLKRGEKLRISKIKSEIMKPEELVLRISRDWGVKIDLKDSYKTDIAEEIVNKLDTSDEYLLLVEIPKDYSKAPDEKKNKAIRILRNLRELQVTQEEPKISLILTCQPNTLNELNTNEKDLKKALKAQKVNLEPYDSENFTEYLEKYIGYSKLNPDFLTTSAKEKILEKSDGIPARINSALKKIIQKLPQEGPIPKIDADYVTDALANESENDQ